MINIGLGTQEISLSVSPTLHITMQEIQFEKHISMLIWISLIQIIIVWINNYRSRPYIGPCTKDFPHHNRYETKSKTKITNTNKELNKEATID